MHVFKGPTADAVWRSAYEGVERIVRRNLVQPSRAGDTHELLHVALEVTQPQERWVLSRRPAMNPAFGIAEAIWLLAGSNDAAVLNFWFPRLPEFAGSGATYQGAYGYRLRRHFGLDQLKQACEALSAAPESRQVVLQLWDVHTDLPTCDGSPRNADVPCNLMSLLKLRRGRLEWTQVMRSNDLHRGLPHNLVQFTILQEVIAGWLGAEVGTYCHWSDCLHIYRKDLAAFSCRPSVALPPNPDSLATDLEQGLLLVKEMYRLLIVLTDPRLLEGELAAILDKSFFPESYQNLLSLLCAEAARRRKWHEEAESSASRCSNPQLRAAWLEWYRRVAQKPKGLGA